MKLKSPLLNKFLKAILEFKDKEIVYRGQSNADWEVISGAYRRLQCPDSQKLLEYNQSLIQRARRYPEWTKETITDINLLAKLQHHDAATSLIDFTKSALVALWFACQDKDKDGKVFCLDLSDTAKFLEMSPKEEKEGIDKILALEFREKQTNDSACNQLRKNTNNISSPDYNSHNQSKESNKIAKWEPTITNNRILKQDSFFIFNEEGRLKDALFKIFIIRKKKKEGILKELKQLSNLSEETLFSDFYGFAQNNAHSKPYGSQDAESYFLQGNKNFGLGKHQEAIADYNKAIELNSKYTQAYNNRGNVKFVLEKHQEAIADYNKAIELNSKYTQAYNNRGNVKFVLGKHQEAIEDYNEAIELDPKYTKAYNNRGNAKSELGQHQEAIEDYNKAIELDPQDAIAYYNRGLVNQNLENYPAAIVDYNKAIELDPKYTQAYNNRGLVNQDLENYKEAIADYNKAIELNPQDAKNYSNQDHANSALGKHQEAIKDISKAKTLFAKAGNTKMVKECEKEIARLKKLLTPK